MTGSNDNQTVLQNVAKVHLFKKKQEFFLCLIAKKKKKMKLVFLGC
jgi:hypothetical protein